MKKLLLGISSGIIYTLVSMATALLTAPYYLHYINKEAFGLFYLLNNLIIWIGLLNGGLRASFKIQLSAKEAKREHSEPLVVTVFFTQFIIALLVSCIGFFISFFLPDFFQKDAVSSKEISIVFSILTLSFALSLISNSFSAFLSVHNKDGIIYSARTSLVIIQALISIFFLSLGLGITGLSLAALFCESTFVVLMLFQVYKVNHLLFSRKLFRISHLKETFSLGKWFMIGFLAQLLTKHTDFIIIASIEGISIVASFIFTSKLYVLMLAILQMILKVSLPQLTKAIQVEATKHRSMDASLLLLKLSSGFIILTGTIVFIINKPFIAWWVGQPYYLGESVNAILLLTFVFTALTLTARTILTASLHLKEQKLSALGEGVLHILLSAILGKLFNIQGFLLGILLSSFAAFLFSIYQLSYMLRDDQGIKKETRAIGVFIIASIFAAIYMIFYPVIFSSIILILLIAAMFLFFFIKDLKFLKQSFFKS